MKPEGKYGRIFTADDVRGLLEDLAGLDSRTDFRGYLRMLAERLDDMKGTFPADEPVFVLRAKDEAARLAIADYQRRCIKAGAATPHIEGIGRALRAFGIFAGVHSARMKVPDTAPPDGGCPECGKPQGAGHAPTCSRAA